MTNCYDDGALRAFADDALPDAQRRAISAHLAGCAACQRRFSAVQVVAARAATLLAVNPAPSDARAALARFINDRPTTNDQRPASTLSRHESSRHEASHPASRIPHPASSIKHQTSNIKPRNPMNTHVSRRWIGAAATLLVAVALLALPPVRAAADQLLQVFRVQQVLFVPVSEERMAQLKNLNFDKDTLFVSKPKVVNTPAAPRTVANAQEATSAVGFPVAQPSAFPTTPTSTTVVVMDRRVMETQINVESARQLLKLMQVDDVTLPDALGAQPISADASPSVVTTYGAPGYSVDLVQGRSPAVTLPDGVDLAQLGKAMLRLLGTESSQAEAMSQQIDWSSTFVVPFPANVNNMRQVTINGAKGVLVRAHEQDTRVMMVYWQQGERFFVLRAHGGISDTELLTLADSVR